jgi:hypothetical protein
MAASDSSFFLVNVSSGSGPKVFAKISPQDAALALQYKWRVVSSRKGRDGKQHLRYAYSVEKSNGVYTRIKMHRLIMSPPDGMHVDHINGDGLDNRRENLRVVTPQLNQANSRKHLVGGSRFKGVCWHAAAKKWRAYIAPDRKQIHLGLYDSEMEAAEAYDRKAKEIFGEHAFTNL